jgi:uncharacterized repeat protein (TIGR01451 family)
MATNTAGRGKAPLWAIMALLAAMVGAMGVAVVAFGTTAGAQTAQGVDLNLKKSISPRVVAVGENQTFTIRVDNEGNRRARNVVMRDPLPDKVRFIRASTSRQVPGSCGLRDRTVVCDLGTLRPGRTVTVKIVVRVVEAGTYTNRAFVSCCTSSIGEGDLDPSDNTDTATGEGIQEGGAGDPLATLRAELTGEQEVPGPGDEDGSGTAVVKVFEAEVCYTLTVENTETATAAHIHLGLRGEAGPIVQDLGTPTNYFTSDCQETTRALSLELREHPSRYYVNVHNEPFPLGAIRGQLHR